MLIRSVILALPLACALLVYQGQDSRPASEPAAQGKPEMDMQKVMAKMMELARPGKEHKALAATAGEWTATTRYRMGDKAPWQEGKATITNKVVLGGRWVIQEYKSSYGGMPFEGMQILGYDNLHKKYVSTWRDTMSTWAVRSEGAPSADGKTIVMKGQMFDVITPQGRPMKTIIKLISDREEHFEMYDTIDGKEVLVMTQVSKKK